MNINTICKKLKLLNKNYIIYTNRYDPDLSLPENAVLSEKVKAMLTDEGGIKLN